MQLEDLLHTQLTIVNRIRINLRPYNPSHTNQFQDPYYKKKKALGAHNINSTESRDKRHPIKCKEFCGYDIHVSSGCAQIAYLSCTQAVLSLCCQMRLLTRYWTGLQSCRHCSHCWSHSRRKGSSHQQS